MKDWVLSLPRPARHVLLGLLALTIMVALVMLVRALGSIGAAYAAGGRAEQVGGRLLGYAAVEDRLREASDRVDARLEQLVYPADLQRDQIQAQVQQVLRDLAVESGLTVSGSQIVDEDSEDLSEKLLTVQVRLSMVGPPMAIDAFLSDLYDRQPIMLVEALTIDPVRNRSRREQADNAAQEDLSVRATVRALGLIP